ncbi:MAG: hypothetical protein NT007_06945, partial [Candidatus Kapabacteria bacterium]|nr:hypothetical protein [Candidatus Kapabacteria bacterium]
MQVFYQSIYIVISAHAGIPIQYQSGDSCIRRNDIFVKYVAFEFVCLKSRLNQKLINLVFGKNKIYKQLMEKPCLEC